MTPPACWQMKLSSGSEFVGSGVAEMNVMPAGSGSRTTTLNASSVPSFDTLSVYSMVPPGWTAPASLSEPGMLLAVWVILRSAKPPAASIFTCVTSSAALLPSWPSGIVLSGSTTTRRWAQLTGLDVVGCVGANTCSFTTRAPPPLMRPPVQLTTPEASVQVNAALGSPWSSAEMNSVPDGSVALNDEPKASAEPWFSTEMS